MKQEFNIVINQNSETGEVLMRIGIPYDDSSFKDFINIACCYNPEIEYVDGILNIKIRNTELIPSFIKIGISFYLSMNRTKYLCG